MKFTTILISMFVGILITTTSCSQKREEHHQQDSLRIDDFSHIDDSIAREEALMEQKRMDSIRQDSIDKIEKFKAAIPTLKQIDSNDPQKLFSKLGYKITTKRGYDERVDEYYTYVAKAIYEVNDKMKVTYQPIEGGFTITITGAPEARDKFYSDAKASIAKSKRECPDDAWISEWYAKISGDKITVYRFGD